MAAHDIVVFLGAGAQHNRLMVDLDYPSLSLYTRHTRRITDDFDLARLHGYHSDQVWYVAMDPSSRMWDFVRARGFRPTSLEATKQWLKSLRDA